MSPAWPEKLSSVTPRVREEALNVRLADLLTSRGGEARGEEVVSEGGSTSLPDVRVLWRGVRMAIEAKHRAPGAAAEVIDQARGRLAANLAVVGVGVLYPPELRDADDPASALPSALLSVKFIAEGGREGDWLEVEAAELPSLLDRARELLVADDAVALAVARLDRAVAAFEHAVEDQVARGPDLLAIVSAREAGSAVGPSDQGAIVAARAISGLTVAAACMLQVELARSDPHVPRLDRPSDATWRDTLIDQWRQILAHDYAAGFAIALDVLEALDGDPTLEHALEVAVEAARAIAAQRVIGRHDLIGRIYHQLLADQKYLATYYTSVSAATLLNTLALERGRWPATGWDSEPSDFALTVGDFACGTGTLLVNAANALSEQWAEARAEAGKAVDGVALGRRLIEHSIHGYDVLAYAVQTCATTLLLGAPGTVVDRTHLYQMPFGGPAGQLGSLDMIAGETAGRLFDERTRVEISAAAAGETDVVGVPQLDYVVMNPPFTRSVGGSRLLGSLTGQPFETARDRLRALMARPDVTGSLTAGLGAPFVDLAVRAVRPGGRLALVLPKTTLTGESWRSTRQLLAEQFHLEWAIVSHETGRWNFSDSTDLSEAMLILRRRAIGESRSEGEITRWVALRRNPRNSVEALGVAAALERLGEPPAAGAPIQVTGELGADAGETWSAPSPQTGAPWREGTFSRALLAGIAEDLLARRPLALPQAESPTKLPLTTLEDTSVGLDVRDVHDAFERGAQPAGYPAWWGHRAADVRALAQASNAELRPRTTPAPGRQRIKEAGAVWRGAGRLMLAERLRLTTHRCAAVLLPERALSNSWWELRLADADDAAARALVLWLNSTLGLIALLAIAEETEGPWIKLKKNKLPGLAVLDPVGLDAAARAVLADAYDELAEAELLPLSRLDEDPVRVRIDEAIAEAVGLPSHSLAVLRRLFASEPRLRPAFHDDSETTPADDGLTLF